MQDLSNMSLAEMFKLDAETHLQALTEGLIGLEQHPDRADFIESCMRAAHSIKGGARVLGLDAGVKVAHAMEDCFVKAQEGDCQLRTQHIDALLQGIDLLQRIANTPEAEMSEWESGAITEIEDFVNRLTSVPEDDATTNTEKTTLTRTEIETEIEIPHAVAGAYRAMRVNTENMNRLLGLAGESLVISQWLKPFTMSLQRLKKLQHDIENEFDQLADLLHGYKLDIKSTEHIFRLKAQITGIQESLSEHLAEIEVHDRQSIDLSSRLYEETLACRMRPFSDVTLGLPRMVRDLGRSLGKKGVLRIEGENTQVDRDILSKLEAPLRHLLRNAVDHGIEDETDRLLAFKPEEGQIKLEARHQAGMLVVNISDDGGGIDLEKLRAAVIKRRLASVEIANTFGTAELLEFLFLPGFTMKETVTEISGRGVGLDAVQDMLKQVRGTVQINTELSKGTTFQLRLPLTLSVLRALLVEISGEPYAFPLAQITHALKVPYAEIESLEGKQYFRLYGENIGMVAAYQVLELKTTEPSTEIMIIVIGTGQSQYGIAVDKFLGEQELVVQRLDARLGKIPNISAGALMKNGDPVLIVDVDDMIVSVGKLLVSSPLSKVYTTTETAGRRNRKRVLVVDDSLTVRELERKLLTTRGYDVTVAVDGMDGWNAVRTGQFDLVISDIDMPRMDGIEFVGLIKKHTLLKHLPVMIVSYKDREIDRQRGLEAGADYYLAKSSFHDQTLLQAVTDLIGEAER